MFLKTMILLGAPLRHTEFVAPQKDGPVVKRRPKTRNQERT